jgi:peroxiredoxin
VSVFGQVVPFYEEERFMIRHGKIAIGIAAAVLLAATSCYAAKLKIGEKAPDWQGIKGVDDASHALADYKDAKLVVLVFTCNHCPVAQAYQDRLVQFQNDYKDRGVQVVAVNVNDIPPDRLGKMQERAKEAGFNFPYLFDPTQKIGRDYGATCTPHFFLLDGDRKIAYTGAMDDSMNAKKVKKHYLRDAVDAVLAGKKPPETVTQQFGCSIKWKKG